MVLSEVLGAERLLKVDPDLTVTAGDVVRGDEDGGGGWYGTPIGALDEEVAIEARFDGAAAVVLDDDLGLEDGVVARPGGSAGSGAVARGSPACRAG
ncbi:hypothetical protein ACHGLA_36395 [Streptomyces sp. YH02]|uniref:hypothetical protein n=1 Tax=Streptomyces sp. YH02 TaxID=3256999 RepID=UPI003757807A